MSAAATMTEMATGKSMTVNEVISDARAKLGIHDESGDAVGFQIDRNELKSDLLSECSVEISIEDLNALSEPQTQDLANWYAEYPDDSSGSRNEDDPDAEFNSWIGEELPEFLELGEPNGEIRRVILKTKPAAEKPITSEKHLALIAEANQKAKRLRARLDEAASDVREAKGREKSAREDLDNAEKYLSGVIDDAKHGQGRLPFDGDGTSVTVNGHPMDSAEARGAIVGCVTSALGHHPISELGSSALKKTVGAIAFDDAKESGDPIGLSDLQIEKLEAAEWTTVELLEKGMREVRDWWSALAGKQDAAIVARVVSTLAAFRRVRPQE